MRRGEGPSESGRIFKTASLALLAFVLLVVVAAVVLVQRGRAQMEESDVAFHEGKMRDAILHARGAALSYVPGSDHVNAAYGRLEAIARGAEADNRRQLAQFAWETLSVVHQQTDYPGRPQSVTEARAVDALKRLKHDSD